MSQNPKSETERSPLDEAALREQLGKLLAHPLFANSKRYPAFLAYVVDKTLNGNGAEIKERSIGVDVFGREPSYDANSDPVVRITAGEVRKRLTQYYYEPNHAGEPLIELPVGSYQPVFLMQGRQPEATETHVEATAFLEVEPPAPVLAARKSPSWVHGLLVAGIAVLAGVIGLGVGLRYHHSPRPNLVERFWMPFTTGSRTVTFCLGEPAQNLDADAINTLDTPTPTPKSEPLFFRLHHSGHLALADVVTLTRTAATLENKHLPYRVLPASEASFAQLREGPVVLIGGFDNLWTVRLTQKLRFGFESRNGQALLVDRKNPNGTLWATAWDMPYEKLSRDYAIVARFRDSTTGQPVIIAAGISEEGTEAAGEVLYNPRYLQALLSKAPENWERFNMEAVIETQVIDGNPGPPQVLAVEFW